MMKKEKDIYLAYEKWSRTYDGQENPTRDLSSQVLKHLLPSVEDSTVVEAGCGTGINTAWIAPQCQRLIGLDLSDSMLEIARKKISFPHVHFIQHDLQKKWPLEENTVDLVLINLVLEHIQDIEPILRNAARVMRPGAKLIITEYHPDRVAKGTGARFEDTHIANYWHPIEEYLAHAKKIGLQLTDTAEWTQQSFEAESSPPEETVRPLILSLYLEKIKD